MSCSARLPVYFVFAMAFFAAPAGTIIWLLYLLGIVVAVIVGAVLSRTVLKAGEDNPFVMELPPYRMPTLKSLSVHTWVNTRHFIKNAGTVILGMSVLLWFLLNLPWGVENQQDSYFGQVSAGITPLLEPTGFGSYETSGALLTGVIAKEMVVSSLSQIYLADGLNPELSASDTSFWQDLINIAVGFGQATIDALRTLISLIPGVDLLGQTHVENTSLSQAIKENFTPLSAIAFLIFVLLYVPCVATIGAIKQEFGGRWALSAAVYQTTIAWLVAVVVFQGGRFLGFN
jgi:ferrous iron transport protein B